MNQKNLSSSITIKGIKNKLCWWWFPCWSAALAQRGTGTSWDLRVQVGRRALLRAVLRRQGWRARGAQHHLLSHAVHISGTRSMVHRSGPGWAVRKHPCPPSSSIAAAPLLSLHPFILLHVFLLPSGSKISTLPECSPQPAVWERLLFSFWNNPVMQEWVSACSVAQSWQLFVTWGIVAHQTPLYMGFSRQEYWNGYIFPPPRDRTQGSNLRLLCLLHCRQILYRRATREAVK